MGVNQPGRVNGGHDLSTPGRTVAGDELKFSADARSGDQVRMSARQAYIHGQHSLAEPIAHCEVRL
jgi:hypothetical protein